MSEFVTVARRSHVRAGSGLTVRVGERQIALFEVDHQVYAIDALCPHKGGPLGVGYVEGQKVYCPLHGWSFDIKSGACGEIEHEKVATYSVRVDGDEVQIKI